MFLVHRTCSRCVNAHSTLRRYTGAYMPTLSLRCYATVPALRLMASSMMLFSCAQTECICSSHCSIGSLPALKLSKPSTWSMVACGTDATLLQAG